MARQEGSAVEVGSTVEATCGKCRDVTTHVVLARIGGKPSRVECRVCHATHQYRPPAGATATATASKTASRPGAKPSGGARRKSGSSAAAPPPEEVWAKAMRNATGSAIAYATSRRFEVGQRIQHSTFGEGVVIRLASPTVCEILFNTGPRKLLMGS